MRRVGALAAIVVALGTAGTAASAPCTTTYSVRAGDTLSAIAKRFSTTVAVLASRNALDPAGILRIGTKIELEAAACHAASTPPAAAPRTDASLARALDKAIAVPGVSPALTGLAVLDLDANEVVYSLNPDKPLRPASTEKLPVALAALSRLGPGFATKTTVLADGAVTAGVLRGNLVLKGAGDPMLTRSGLRALAQAVRSRGIAKVTGAVVGDESAFDAVRTAPGWKPSFYKDESPPLSALVVDRAVVDGVTADQPALAAATLFVRALREAGVAVAGNAIAGVASEHATPVVARRSPRLRTLLDQMDAWSDNFIAEMVLKQLGVQGGASGSSAGGAAVVTSVLATAGIPLAGLRIADGSGLSSLDLLTARSLVAILQTVWHDTALRTALLPTLAVAGSTGTLRRRLLDVPGHALVRGKTGTTNESSALVGFVGSRYAFAAVVNGFPVNWSAAHDLQDRVARALLTAL